MMINKKLILVLSVLSVLGGGAYLWSQKNQQSIPPVDLFSLPFQDRKGNNFTLEQFKGKPLLVNVWASSCGPCVKELPSLDRLAAKVRAAGGEVLAISSDRFIGESFATFVRNDVKNLEAFHDGSFQLTGRIALNGVPTTLLIDENGKQVAVVEGGLEWDSPESLKMIEEKLGLKL